MIVLVWAILATLGFLVMILARAFSDPGSAIFVQPSKRVLFAMVRLAECNGAKPKFRIETPGRIIRAFLSTGWIFNWVPDKTLLRKLGDPVAAVAYTTFFGSPNTLAVHAVAFLQDEGMTNVRLVIDPDEGVPAGKMTAVTCDEINGRFVIIFRKHFLLMGGKPPAWNWNGEGEE